MYRPEDIAVVNIHNYLREHQSKFFRGGVYDPLETATLIALEALLLGASDVQIGRVDEWILVSSAHDWFARLEGDVFKQLVPMREGGQNSVTAEILAVVFSKSVVTAKDGRVFVVKGDSLGPLIANVAATGRVVAFDVRLDE